MGRLIYSSPLSPKPLLLPRRASAPLLLHLYSTSPLPAPSFVSGRPCSSSISATFRRFPNFPFGATVIISVLVSLLILPFIVSQASATFQSASRAGGPSVAFPGGRLTRAEVFSSAWTGFLAGCLHTLSGPDHLAALAPLSIGRSSLQRAALGALWGCGHDAGQVMFGFLFLTLKDRLNMEVLRTWGTIVVGMTYLSLVPWEFEKQHAMRCS